MTTLDQAKRKILAFKVNPKIHAICESPNFWLFSLNNSEGKPLYIGWVGVSKKTGKCEFVSNENEDKRARLIWSERQALIQPAP